MKTSAQPPPSNNPASQPVTVISGDDDYSVKERGKETFASWQAEQGQNKLGVADVEIIDAEAANSTEAEKALDKLELALQSLPFFGGSKLIWFKNCNFLGEERTATSATVTKHLSNLAELLKSFNWNGVRLLITSGKISATRTIYKVLAKLAVMEKLEAISSESRGWEIKMEQWLRDALKQTGKTMNQQALSTLILFVGANLRQMSSELEKLIIYVGERQEITQQDIEQLVTRNKQSKSFALADAIGERNLPKAIRLLDNDLAEIKTDRTTSEIGILYGIISKVRLMLLLRELINQKRIPSSLAYNQKLTIPDGLLPDDRKFNPALMNPWMVSHCLPHAMKYTTPELVHAMDKLIQCNRKLVFSGGDPALALQQVVIEIIMKRPA